MRKNRFSFIRGGFLGLFIVLFVLISSCEKYSSPNKVERHIVNGTWKLTSVFIDNDDNKSVFADYAFAFSKDGRIDVIGEPTISGTWTTGIEKNPTTLELTLTPFSPFYNLNADWTVTTCKNNRMTLELYGAASTDVLILSKVE